MTQTDGRRGMDRHRARVKGGLDAMTQKTVRFLAIAAAVVLFAGACSSGGGNKGGGSALGATTPAPRTAPQSGGTINFGTFSETAGLDPIVSTGNGVTGFIEMAAIYDTIVRYNVRTGKYENNTAESVTSNTDHTEWTLKLKPNIKFTDGTDYDAEAVAFGMNRHRSGIPGAPPCAQLYACPGNSTSSTAYMALVKDIQVLDKLTVKFILTEPWTGFEYALSAEPSLIPSPTALKKCDASSNVRQCNFNLDPVGAGPFKISSYKPQEVISLVRNPGYFGGPVYLDGINFINNINDGGGAKTLLALNANQLQVAFLRDPVAVSDAHQAQLPGFSTFEQGGGIFLINQGGPVTCAGGKPAPTCTGKPDGPTPTNPGTKNLKVRQAILAATDPQVLNERGYNGKGKASSALFQNDFRWNPGVAGTKYDPQAAKKLVAEAKAEGWDGKVSVLYNNTPAGVALGLATQAMLQAVGMTASLDITKSITAQVNQVVVQKDYELTGWGLAIPGDDGAVWALAQNFLSTSRSNRVGINDPVIDQALKGLLTASTDDQKRALYKTLAQQLNTDAAILPFAEIEEFIASRPNVHGVVQTNRSGAFFDKAWIER
jgi:peptide/nickel transport system substrate-binding protein